MKTLLTLLIISLATSVSAQIAAALQSTAEHRAWIDADQKDDILIIQGKFANDSQQTESFRYELVTTKQGRSGSSSSTQAGSFEASAGEEVSLSNVSVNVSAEDTYLIELKVYRGDTVYLDDKIEYQG